MNQQCKVCGEPAAGFHFGAFTCEGCKSFFGRTYNNLSSISECKNNGECVINKKNRTACKACRLRKCLVVGMSKSGSRYGRRSNWFKIHCLLQEQQAQKNSSSNNNNNTLSANNNDTSSSNNNNNNNNSNGSNSPGLLPNGFLPANFLSNLCNNNNNVPLKKELKRPSSPSDSGASSADPDESAHNSFTAVNNTARTTISPKVEVPEVTLTKISPKTPSRRTPSTSSSSTTTTTSDTFRPLLDRMSPYQLPTSFRSEPTPFFPIPFAIPPVSLALMANKNHHHHPQLSASHEQHEPIDLSMKSKSSSGSGSPHRIGSPLMAADVTGAGDDGEGLSSVSGESAPRPVPLDLTFVRAKALSG